MRKKVLKKLAALAMVSCLVATGCSASSGGSTITPSEAAGTEEQGESEAAEVGEAQSADVETVKIGFLNPFSGSDAESGMLDTEGARLAVKHINESGGIKALGGAQIELIEAFVQALREHLPAETGEQGGLMLFKGSRGNHLEELLEALEQSDWLPGSRTESL